MASDGVTNDPVATGPSPRPAILILGPTAGGKTSLAIELARRLPGGGVCLSADSMQVYREMDIGTAKPTVEEQSQAPHELIDLVDPEDDGFTVQHWLERAEQRITELRAESRWPIVVGGTNLYVQAFLAGLDDGPPPDEALRAELRTLAPDDLRARLLAVDPDAAARIHPNDVKRTIRAIEVHAQTGEPISTRQQEWLDPFARDDVRIIGLEWPVEEINRRINARIRVMMEDGLLEETRALWTAGRLGVQARAALGYAQLIEHLEGRATLEDAVQQIHIRTRRFAKQQRTWLRRFRAHPRSLWIDPTAVDSQTLSDNALAHAVAAESAEAS